MIAATVGLRKDLTSVKAMFKDPDWGIPGGWKEKAQLELDMVVHGKKALVPCTRSEYLAARRQYGKSVELLRILTPAAVKTLADGTPGRHKVRLVVADVNGTTHIEMWQRCLEMDFEAYQLLSTQEDLWFESMDPLGNDAAKAVAMLATCNILLERRHAAIEWATQEVALRIRLFGAWNPRTKRAQQVFYTCVRVPLYMFVRITLCMCAHISIYVAGAGRTTRATARRRCRRRESAR